MKGVLQWAGPHSDTPPSHRCRALCLRRCCEDGEDGPGLAASPMRSTSSSGLSCAWRPLGDTDVAPTSRALHSSVTTTASLRRKSSSPSAHPSWKCPRWPRAPPACAEAPTMSATAARTSQYGCVISTRHAMAAHVCRRREQPPLRLLRLHQVFALGHLRPATRRAALLASIPGRRVPPEVSRQAPHTLQPLGPHLSHLPSSPSK
jgi:hypothetical protein